jgi:hypothetical protein
MPDVALQDSVAFEAGTPAMRKALGGELVGQGEMEGRQGSGSSLEAAGAVSPHAAAGGGEPHGGTEACGMRHMYRKNE